MPKAFGLKGRLWQGGTFVASKAGVWPENSAEQVVGGERFGKRNGMVAQPMRAGLTAQLTGRAENGPCYRSGNASAGLYGDSEREERAGATGQGASADFYATLRTVPSSI